MKKAQRIMLLKKKKNGFLNNERKKVQGRGIITAIFGVSKDRVKK